MEAHLILNCEKGAIKTPEELDNWLFDPPIVRTIFFVYWKWKVPKYILDTTRCVGFHTGPLLEGKGLGGSPIQNLKKLGVKITTLCAFEMNEGFDTGKVRLAVPLSLEGSMENIWARIEEKVPEMVEYLLEVQPEIPKYFTRQMATA